MKTIPETKKMKTREKNVTSQALPTSPLSCDQLQIHFTDHMISNREVMSNISTWQILMLQVKFQTLQNIHQFSSKPHFLIGQCRIHCEKVLILTAIERSKRNVYAKMKNVAEDLYVPFYINKYHICSFNGTW